MKLMIALLCGLVVFVSGCSEPKRCCKVLVSDPSELPVCELEQDPYCGSRLEGEEVEEELSSEVVTEEVES